MKEFRISVTSQATPERVWAVLRDVVRRPEWTSSVTSVRLPDEGPLAVGRRAVVRRQKLLPAVWTVT
jgi:hypothetical protein